MTLPASGPISFNAINVELGVAGTTQASLGQTSYRNLAGVPSGQISMSNFYGKANQFAFTISSNQTNANLRTLAVNAGWNQSSKVVATIASGVYVSANSTGTPALTVNGSFPGGVELVNNGFIVGMGGAGGSGPTSGPGLQVGAGTAGAGGGLALSVSSAISVTNNGTVAGGGGGGGGGRSSAYTEPSYSVQTNYGGGGGGGGRTGAVNSSGGAGGVASVSYGSAQSGAAGGVGTLSSAGSGGNGGYGLVAGGFRGGGGTGGTWGAAGSTGDSARFSDPSAGPYSGGSAGGAVSGNSNITWVATGTRLGAIA